MEILSAQDGLPELGSFDIRLLTVSQMTAPMKTVAESIRLAFSEKAKAIAA
jgi:hypothetical protein